MSSYSEGQTHQLMNALEHAGFTSGDIASLGQSPLLPEFRRVLIGHSEIVQRVHIIDCDANQPKSTGWEVLTHKRMGGFAWGHDKVRLHLVKQQLDRTGIGGYELNELLKCTPVLNANVLDYLLKSPRLIPEEWKGKNNFFWGTVFRTQGGDQRVKYLFWAGFRWKWDSRWLGAKWREGSPAIIAC